MISRILYGILLVVSIIIGIRAFKIWKRKKKKDPSFLVEDKNASKFESKLIDGFVIGFLTVALFGSLGLSQLLKGSVCVLFFLLWLVFLLYAFFQILSAKKFIIKTPK
jgi:Ca2+/Na+ antiporter